MTAPGGRSYEEFIEEPTKCYVGALQQNEPDLPALGNLYAKIGRMRVLSSRAVADEPNHCVESDSSILDLTLLNNTELVGVASHRAALRFEQLNALRILPVQLEGASARYRSTGTQRRSIAPRWPWHWKVFAILRIRT